MVGTAIFLLVFSGQAQDPPNPHQITCEVREVPGKLRPIFRVEGTAKLPAGARLEIECYYGRFQHGMHLGTAAVPVVDGKYEFAFKRFGATHSAFPERIMAGRYIFRIVFEKGLQRFRALQKEPKSVKMVTYAIGDALDMQDDQRTVRLMLLGQAKEMCKMADEIVLAGQKHPSELGTSKWKERTEDWLHRCHEIEKIARATPEYGALQIHGLAGNLERIHQFLEALAYFVGQKNEGAIREGRARITRTLQEYERMLAQHKISRKETLELATEAQKLLKKSPKLDGDPLGDARRKFMKAIMAIGGADSAKAYGDMVEKLMTTTRPYFAGLEKKEDVKNLQSVLEDELEDLIDVLQEEDPGREQQE